MPVSQNPNPIYSRRKPATSTIRKMFAPINAELRKARAAGDAELVERLKGLKLAAKLAMLKVPRRKPVA